MCVLEEDVIVGVGVPWQAARGVQGEVSLLIGQALRHPAPAPVHKSTPNGVVVFFPLWHGDIILCF